MSDRLIRGLVLLGVLLVVLASYLFRRRGVRSIRRRLSNRRPKRNGGGGIGGT